MRTTGIELTEGGEPWAWCDEIDEVRDEEIGRYVLRLKGFKARKKALEHLSALRQREEHRCELVMFRSDFPGDAVTFTGARIVRREKEHRTHIAIVQFDGWHSERYSESVEPQAGGRPKLERPVTAQDVRERTGHDVAGEVLRADITTLTRWQLCALAIEAVTLAEIDTAGDQRGAAIVATEQRELADLREARRLLRRAQERWD